MDQGALASSATPWERLFLECDKQGRVLWMNDRARARLGSIDSLFDAVPESLLPEVSLWLGADAGGTQDTLISTLQRSDRLARVPVQFVRLLALEGRVVLSAEVRARVSDRQAADHSVQRILMRLQSNATRNYFRLQEAHAWLSGPRRGNKSTAAVVVEALEMERTRIARGLHSEAGQTLTAIKVNLELIAARWPEMPEAVQKGLERIDVLADQALSEVRSVSQRLYQPDWQRTTLTQAIEWLWVNSGIPEKFHATLELNPLESEIPDSVRFVVYRAVQEGIANVLRHAGATELKLQLREREGRIFLVLEDNGIGFNSQAALNGELVPSTGGIGLRAMRDEVYALGGTLHLNSGQGGTRMEIALPIMENR